MYWIKEPGFHFKKQMNLITDENFYTRQQALKTIFVIIK